MKAVASFKTLWKDLENGVLKEEWIVQEKFAEFLKLTHSFNAVIAEVLKELKVSGLLSLPPSSYAVNSSLAQRHIRWSSKIASW